MQLIWLITKIILRCTVSKTSKKQIMKFLIMQSSPFRCVAKHQNFINCFKYGIYLMTLSVTQAV